MGSLPLSIGFNATGSLPFQLASMPRVHCRSFGLMPRVHCHFQLASMPWVHCHFQLALMPWVHCRSIGFIATSSLPFIWLNATGSLPLSIGFIALSWVHCLSHRDTPLLICLFGAPYAFMAPHLPFGAPFAFWRPNLPFWLPIDCCFLPPRPLSHRTDANCPSLLVVAFLCRGR